MFKINFSRESRTIADLDGGADLISDKHIAETIKLRNDLDLDLK